MDTTLKEYDYAPLGIGRRIRVICLHPSTSPHSPLVCNIHEIDLDQSDDPAYEAISYTWGEPKFPCILQVAGEGRILRITQNLDVGLRHFRLADKPRYIWADAVCMNQKDDVEKSTQIPLMADIYRGAEGVLVWLGECAEAETAMRTFQQLGRAVRTRAGEDDLRKAASALDVLFKQAWFRRRWIIQEVVLNPDVTVFCKSASISWPRLLTSALSLAHRIEDRAMAGALAAMDRLWATLTMRHGTDDEGHNGAIWGNLEDFDEFGCGDPRDRIFALVALSSGVIPEEGPVSIGNAHHSPDSISKGFYINPDYTKTTKRVYIDFAAEAARHGLLFCMLFRTWGRQPYRELPAWVPDWRDPAGERPRFVQRLMKNYPARTVLRLGYHQHVWRNTQLRGDALRLRGVSVTMPGPPETWRERGYCEDGFEPSGAAIRPLWISQPIAFKNPANIPVWFEALVQDSVDCLMGVSKSPFEVTDVAKIWIYLIEQILAPPGGYPEQRPDVRHWDREEGKIQLGNLLATEWSAFHELDGGHFVVCSQSHGKHHAVFLGYTPTPISKDDMLIRLTSVPSISDSISIRSRVHLVWVMREQEESGSSRRWTDLPPSERWTQHPLGELSNCFNFQGQGLLIDLKYNIQWVTQFKERRFDFEIV